MKYTLLIISAICFAGALFGQFQVNGDAETIGCNCYQLTPDLSMQGGSVWNLNQISLEESFQYSFQIYLGTNDGGADGIAFGLQQNSVDVGTNGGGMGFQGISPSVGVFVDTWQNVDDADPFDDHISINANGIIDHDGSATDLAGPVTVGNLEDGVWRVLEVNWDAGSMTLEVYLEGELTTSYTGDIVNDIFNGDPMVFWGFTGGTGAATNLQQFCTALDSQAFLSSIQACPGEEILFENNSIVFGSIDSLIWTLEDGVFSNESSLTYSFPEDSVYVVTLEVFDETGCSDTEEIEVQISSPSIEIQTLQDQVCSGTEVQLESVVTLPEYTCTYTAFLYDETGDGWSGSYINILLDNILETELALDDGFSDVVEFEAVNGQVMELEWINSDTWEDEISFSLVDPFGIEVFSVPVGGFDGLEDGVIFADTAQCSGAVGELYYTWEGDGISGPFNALVTTALPIISTQYSVSATDSMGCSAEASILLQVSDMILMDSTQVNDCEDDPTGVVIIEAQNGIWPYFYELDSGEINGSGYFPSLAPGFYNATVTDAIGCQETIAVEVGQFPCPLEIFIPNVFTPNDDNENDVFSVEVSGDKNFKLEIFNRWGMPVYSTIDLAAGWDGKAESSGEDVPEGVYFYVISGEELETGLGRQFKGHVQILR